MSTTRLDCNKDEVVLHLDEEPKLNELLDASRKLADVRSSWATLLAMTVLVLATTLLMLALGATPNGCLVGVVINLIVQAGLYQWRLYYERNRFRRIKGEWLKSAEAEGWNGVKKARENHDSQ